MRVTKLEKLWFRQVLSYKTVTLAVSYAENTEDASYGRVFLHSFGKIQVYFKSQL